MDESMRETIKLLIKTLLRFRERALARGHELAEDWEDLVEEARVERAAEAEVRSAASVGIPAAPPRKAAPRGDRSKSTRASKAGPAPRQKATPRRRRSTEKRDVEPVTEDKVRLKPEDRLDETAIGFQPESEK